MHRMAAGENVQQGVLEAVQGAWGGPGGEIHQAD